MRATHLWQCGSAPNGPERDSRAEEREMTYTPVAPLTPYPDYVVPDLELSPQQTRSNCAIASARMLINWRRTQRAQTELAHPSPDEVMDRLEPLRRLDESGEECKPRGIAVKHFTEFARELGLEPMPSKHPTARTLKEWLSNYGPLWLAGHPVTADGRVGSGGHVVVLGGVGTVGSDHFVKIYDPWPVGQGDIRWAPGDHLSLVLKAYKDETLEAQESRREKALRWLRRRQPRTIRSPWETAIFRLPD